MLELAAERWIKDEPSSGRSIGQKYSTLIDTFTIDLTKLAVGAEDTLGKINDNNKLNSVVTLTETFYGYYRKFSIVEFYRHSGKRCLRFVRLLVISAYGSALKRTYDPGSRIEILRCFGKRHN
ncbi:Protein of unknown function [Gryllus bimaculatus]|nr:Protein of unknown function [Gryllus bimaculatus]